MASRLGLLVLALAAGCATPPPAGTGASVAAQGAGTVSTLSTTTAATSASKPREHLARLRAEVHAAEAAFAQSMADRRFDTFAGFVAKDALFFDGREPLRGKAAVLQRWQRFFEGPQAPFAWTPELVEVGDGGTLAYSEGPVARPDGVVVARFASIWRRDADGRWRVVFDRGHEVCRCPRP